MYLKKQNYLYLSTYVIAAKVLETLMENPENKQWLLHAGTKNARAAWILTKACNATTKKNIRIELAYFLIILH